MSVEFICDACGKRVAGKREECAGGPGFGRSIAPKPIHFALPEDWFIQTYPEDRQACSYDCANALDAQRVVATQTGA